MCWQPALDDDSGVHFSFFCSCSLVSAATPVCDDYIILIQLLLTAVARDVLDGVICMDLYTLLSGKFLTLELQLCCERTHQAVTIVLVDYVSVIPGLQMAWHVRHRGGSRKSVRHSSSSDPRIFRTLQFPSRQRSGCRRRQGDLMNCTS